jgi:hypothetical protein
VSGFEQEDLNQVGDPTLPPRETERVEEEVVKLPRGRLLTDPGPIEPAFLFEWAEIVGNRDVAHFTDLGEPG